MASEKKKRKTDKRLHWGRGKYIPIDLWNTQKMIDKLKKEKEVSNG